VGRSPGVHPGPSRVPSTGATGSGVSFWESEDGVNASGDLGAEARQALAETAGASSQSPEVWEVAVDDRQ